MPALGSVAKCESSTFAGVCTSEAPLARTYRQLDLDQLHVAVEPGAPVAVQGAGGVHHVAFRVPDADHEAWADRLRRMRVPNSGPVDRFYFREPAGILFEIATDGPGFAADEPAESLGERLALPPF